MAEHPPAPGGTERAQTGALAGPQPGLLRSGFVLELWNVVGIVVLAVAAVGTRSVPLTGFGLDSLIEIGASTVVVYELSGTGEDRQRRALRLIGGAFVALAGYLATAELRAGTGSQPAGDGQRRGGY